LHISREAFDTIMEALDTTFKMIYNIQGTQEKVIKVSIEENDVDLQCQLLGDPHISKTKGRKNELVKESKNGHFKGDIECSKRSKRQCKDCDEFGHYPITCERRKWTKVSELIDF
jgi:hypothetical protein